MKEAYLVRLDDGTVVEMTEEQYKELTDNKGDDEDE